MTTTLALAVGFAVWATDASAKPSIPLPKPRPIARNVVPKTTPAAKTAAKNSSSLPAVAAPAAILPATRQHAALPPPTARKPPAPAALAATASPARADADALENVIELVRKHQPADATEAEAAISDPVARKLAEWIILRSDDHGASGGGYRACI